MITNDWSFIVFMYGMLACFWLEEWEAGDLSPYHPSSFEAIQRHIDHFAAELKAIQEVTHELG